MKDMDSIEKLRAAKKWFEDHPKYEEVVDDLPDILTSLHIHANFCMDLAPVANQTIQNVIDIVERDSQWANEKNLEKYFLSQAHGMADKVLLYEFLRNQIISITHTALDYLKMVDEITTYKVREPSEFLLQTKNKAERILNLEYNDNFDSNAFKRLVNEFKIDAHRLIPNTSDIRESSNKLFAILPLLTKHHIFKLTNQPNEHLEIVDAIKKEVRSIQLLLPNR